MAMITTIGSLLLAVYFWHLDIHAMSFVLFASAGFNFPYNRMPRQWRYVFTTPWFFMNPADVQYLGSDIHGYRRCPFVVRTEGDAFACGVRGYECPPWIPKTSGLYLGWSRGNDAYARNHKLIHRG